MTKAKTRKEHTISYHIKYATESGEIVHFNPKNRVWFPDHPDEVSKTCLAPPSSLKAVAIGTYLDSGFNDAIDGNMRIDDYAEVPARPGCLSALIDELEAVRERAWWRNLGHLPPDEEHYLQTWPLPPNWESFNYPLSS